MNEKWGGELASSYSKDMKRASKQHKRECHFYEIYYE